MKYISPQTKRHPQRPAEAKCHKRYKAWNSGCHKQGTEGRQYEANSPLDILATDFEAKADYIRRSVNEICEAYPL